MLNVAFALVVLAPDVLFPRANKLLVTLSAVVDKIERRSPKSWSCVVTKRSRKLGEDIFEVKCSR